MRRTFQVLEFDGTGAYQCGIDNSGEEQRLIRTVARKGFRFVGCVREARMASVLTKPSKSNETYPLALPDKLHCCRAREGFDIGEHEQLSPHRWKSSRFDGLLFGHNVQFDQID